MPTYTFPSTYCAATLQGITPILIDVNEASGCLEVENIKDIPLDQYDSVVTVCALSSIPNLQALQDFCKENDKKLIVDGAATFGTPGIAKYGDAFCISLHATKAFPVGEGGIIVADHSVHEKVQQFIEFGLDSTKTMTMIGLNGKISDYTAAIALSILDQIEPHIQRRLLNHHYLNTALPDIDAPYRMPVSFRGADTVYQFAPIFMDSEYLATKTRRMLKDEGIPCLQYYTAMSAYKVAHRLYSTNLCVPIHSGVDKADLDTVLDVLQVVSEQSF
jgi:dTDP-4-amino-4,6-dideoxygalactose transaminase